MEANAKSHHQEAKRTFSSLTDADINFFEKGNTDLCELQQNTLAPLSKLLVVDSGAGETVMPVGLVDKSSFDRVRWVQCN